uniref:Uncharacterized protein n=1 Tax=Manihot esculenta TaxID=3983 RepID=A0A2C9UDM1_MANES
MWQFHPLLVVRETLIPLITLISTVILTRAIRVFLVQSLEKVCDLLVHDIAATGFFGFAFSCMFVQFIASFVYLVH